MSKARSLTYLLLNTVLNDTTDLLARHALADHYEELGVDHHAQLIRIALDYQWVAYQVVEPSYKLRAYVLGKRCRYSGNPGCTFQWVASVENHETRTRQPWQWRAAHLLNPRVGLYPYGGYAPNKNNAIRRASRLLFEHHKRNCVCNSVKLVNGFLSTLRGRDVEV